MRIHPFLLLLLLLPAAALGAAALLAAVPQDPAPRPAPAPAPAPPAPAPAGDPEPGSGEGKPVPLTVEALDTLLGRAQQNVIRHGLTLDPKFLQWAVNDFATATSGLPPGLDASRTFSAWFGLAFMLARADAPSDPAMLEARAKDVFDALDRASKADPWFPGLFIVHGMMLELQGENRSAADKITLGLDALDKAKGIQGWQAYQLRLFGLLSRGRALLDPAMNAAQLSQKDFEAALALAEEALKDPAAPRPTRLRIVVQTHLAAAYQRLDYYDAAEKVLKQLMRDDPGSAVHPYNLALMKVLQQQFVEAVSLYRRAAGLDRADPRPHIKIAYLLLKYLKDGMESAVPDAEREGEVYLHLIGDAPDVDYLSLKGEIAQARGDLKESEKWVRRALALDPTCRTALNRLLFILRQREDSGEEARKEIEEVHRRLEESMKKHRGGGKDSPKGDSTFC